MDFDGHLTCVYCITYTGKRERTCVTAIYIPNAIFQKMNNEILQKSENAMIKIVCHLLKKQQQL